jgi:AcrR family transcriptional regulator
MPARESVSAPATSRTPQQPRGLMRKDIILDATAGLIAESGIEGVNMRRVAKAARSAVGSLYHFFSSRDSLLQAVANRHAQGVGEITARLRALEPGAWQRMSAQQVADLLIRGYADYGRQHPDFFLTRRYLPAPDVEAEYLALLRQVLDSRLPAVRSETQQCLVDTIHGILMGGVNVASQGGQARMACFLEEIPFVLGAYLASLESRFSFAAADKARSEVNPS